MLGNIYKLCGTKLLVGKSPTIFGSTAVLAATCATMAASAEKAANIYGFDVKDIDGNDVSMSRYQGKVVLIVNVASAWGLTKANYAQLAKLHESHADKGLAIVGFPCNQFGSQEPGSNAEIKAFAAAQGAKFDMMDKVNVNGNAIPLYVYLKKKCTGTLTNAIKWNFSKFLVNKEGVAVKRYSPQTEPVKILPDIEKLLAE